MHCAYLWFALQIEIRGGTSTIVLNNKMEIEQLTRNCLDLLMAKTNGCMKISTFLERYKGIYHTAANLMELELYLHPAIMVSKFLPLCIKSVMPNSHNA